MAFKKKTGGRTIGSTNRIPTEIKEMIRQALINKGGIAYFEKQADANPTSFMSLIGRIIPIDVDITKTHINVHVGLYPEEKNEQHKPIASQEATKSVH